MSPVLVLVTWQLQTMTLPPKPSPSLNPPSTAVEITGLPDLVLGGIRVTNESNVEFEVRNKGGAAARPVPLIACAYAGDRHYCSASHSVGTLQPGEGKWVRVDCFYRPPQIRSMNDLLPSGAGPVCDLPTSDSERSITKYSVRVDGGGSMADEYFAQNNIGRRVPSALQPVCTPEYGCVQEIDETNNRAEFEAPF